MSASLNAQESALPENQQPPTEESLDHGLPLWEAGVIAGGFSQPAYPGAVERVNLLAGLPFLIYRGNYLRIDRDTVGVRAVKTPRTELDVGFAASLGSRADDIVVRRGMADLGAMIEFGPRLKINLGDVSEGSGNSRIQIPVRGVFDAHDHLAYRGIAYELQWVRVMEASNGWRITTNLGALLGDQQLVDTFYRVAASEATSARPAYNATPGLIATRATISVSHLFATDLRWASYLRYDSVESAANHASPLVRRDDGWIVGIVLAWTLAHSTQTAYEE